MTLENCLERVIKAIKVCKKKPALAIDGETRLRDDLAIDSFEMLMLANELEAEFDISIAEADFDGILTVGDIARRLVEKC
ncbi:MAG: phosphopantetheine-binding protein [Zoogloeaceae bacterium]|jgi:acyl carrier protein|nr:phosphopantetheine-binding protein [Zoogloeaceae bacterium]